jgi:hypothetical protein
MPSFKHEISGDYTKAFYCIRCNMRWSNLVGAAEILENRTRNNEMYLDFVNRLIPCTVSDEEYIIKKLLE